MVKLAESISAAYEERKKDAENRLQKLKILRNEVHDELSSFKKQTEQMSVELQKSRHDLLGKLHVADEELKNSVKDMMDAFGVNRLEKNAEQAGMLQEFRNTLNDSVGRLLQLFTTERQDMKSAQEEDLASMMKSLEGSAQDMKQNVQQMMKRIRQERQEGAKKVREQLDHLIDELRQGSEALEKVQDVGGSAVSKAGTEQKKKVESVRAPVAAEQKEESVIDAESSVQAVKEDSHTASEDLEERVLEYIASHPEGVRVGEMADPLGTNRMRLGVIAKKLYENNKIRREENLYLPL